MPDYRIDILGRSRKLGLAGHDRGKGKSQSGSAVANRIGLGYFTRNRRKFSLGDDALAASLNGESGLEDCHLKLK